MTRHRQIKKVRRNPRGHERAAQRWANFGLVLLTLAVMALVAIVLRPELVDATKLVYTDRFGT